MKNGQAIFVKAIAVWLVLTTLAVTVVTWKNPKMRAVLGMGWGLILLWIGGCGSQHLSSELCSYRIWLWLESTNINPQGSYCAVDTIARVES